MKIHNCTQGSSEWMHLRMGKPTASQFHRIVTPTGKPSAQASDYCNELLAELMMGRPLEGPTMMWMEYGKATEAEARAYYEMQRNVTLEQIGFITNDAETIGASPDSLCGSDGMVEIKCPSPGVHVQYLLSVTGKADRAYYPQLQGQLLVADRPWIDIISYHPEMPSAIVRVERDEQYLAVLSEELNRFLAILDERRMKLERMGWINAPKEDEQCDWLNVTEDDVRAILKEKG